MEEVSRLRGEEVGRRRWSDVGTTEKWRGGEQAWGEEAVRHW
jgi:hypothetical protein